MTTDRDTGAAGEPATATEPVRALYFAVLDAWNARDAEAYGACFTEEGHVVGFDGSVVDGRQEIVAHLAPIFADHPTATYVAKVREIRLLGPDAALLRAVAGMVPRGGHDINPAVNVIQSLVATKQGGEWRVALFQNTPAAFHGRPELADQLTDELRRLLRLRGAADDA